MTKKLFHSDQYQTMCQAIVQSIQDNIVVLDQTVFFAFSGGQESDTGTIGGIEVINATDTSTKDTPGPIEYELNTTPDFIVGDTVTVSIDEKRRQDIMRLHTAVHLVYYFVIERLGDVEIIGSHISQGKGRIDFETEINLNEIREDIQDQLKTYIQQEHDIQTLADESDQNIRWWECEDYKMMCAGTHVQNTKEIGIVKLKRKNLGSGKERIEIIFDEKAIQ
jgi:Ser-tRNA(Ala) deacylase AlaX